MADDEEVLAGGIANAGGVVRQGRDVIRPANTHSASIHRFLAALRANGFDGASLPVGFDPDGRERLGLVEGDVALPPYPAWAQDDRALESVARLMRRMHDATVGINLGDATWSDEMADDAGGAVMCHNDVCLENVVFREGKAVALLDWDFAAPGRREYDLAAFARMCVPVDDDSNAGRLGWMPADRPRRLRLVCEAYGLDATGRDALIERLSESIARGGEFVMRRVARGEPAFVEMWNSLGGRERFDRRRQWWAIERNAFAAALA